MRMPTTQYRIILQLLILEKMEQDCDYLAKLCRVCSGNISKHRVTLLWLHCKGRQSGKIFAYWLQQPSSTPDKILPKMLHCNEKNERTWHKNINVLDRTQIVKHACKRYDDICKPGRNVKAHKGGKHLTLIMCSMSCSSNKCANSTRDQLVEPPATVCLSKSRFSVPPGPIKLEDFVCECWCPKPEAKCRHIMCKVCQCKHLLKNTQTPPCPVCSESTSDFRPLANTLTNNLSKLELRSKLNVAYYVIETTVEAWTHEK